MTYDPATGKTGDLTDTQSYSWIIVDWIFGALKIDPFFANFALTRINRALPVEAWSQVPFLGICLGYQLLFSTSEEFGEGRGLDIVPGAVRRLPAGQKIPHMGWNRVEHAGDLAIFDGIPSGSRFYFVHSFYPVVAGASRPACTEGGLTQGRVAPDARSTASLRTGWCEYGVRFAAAIEVGRIHATQFHPEKSQAWGIRMLENFAAIVKDGR